MNRMGRRTFSVSERAKWTAKLSLSAGLRLTPWYVEMGKCGSGGSLFLSAVCSLYCFQCYFGTEDEFKLSFVDGSA